MKRLLASSLTLAGLICGGATRAECRQAAAIPLSLGITASPTEVAVGGTVSVVVNLKNYQGDAVSANEPISVTLHSELGGDASVTFKTGQSSAQTVVRFQRGGVATLVATAPKMTSGSAVVVVNTGSPAPPSAAAAARPASASTFARPPVPTSNAGGDANIALNLDVLPQHVHPSNASWRALVLVTAFNETKQPIAVPADTVVYLATDIGQVTPAVSRIEAGKARTAESIQLTSDRAGGGTLWAWTDAGRLTAAAVEYHEPVPTQLVVKGLPSHVVNDGKTAVNVTVFLQDDTAATATADHDVSVKLTSSVGTPSPSDLSIPKGKFFAEAFLTSPTSGTAEITATAPRFKPGSVLVEFVFPFLLITLAGAGGLIGSVVRSGRRLFTGAWRWHLLGSVGMGIVLGLLFYALALFGIVASIPKLAIPLAQLPTTNELGALVLGFLGGYYARAWLPNPSSLEAHNGNGHRRRATAARR